METKGRKGSKGEGGEGGRGKGRDAWVEQNKGNVVGGPGCRQGRKGGGRREEMP